MSERTEKNAGLVRAEDRGRALDANRGGGDHGLVNQEKRARKPAIIFNAALFPILPGIPPESLRFLRTDLKSPTARMSIALPALVDVGSMFLVPISHAATPTSRGAYCFFLNIGN